MIQWVQDEGIIDFGLQLLKHKTQQLQKPQRHFSKNCVFSCKLHSTW